MTNANRCDFPLSPTPIFRFAGGYNLYSYVVNNPINYIDPNGLEAVLPLPGAAGAGSAASAGSVVKPINPWLLLVWPSTLGEEDWDPNSPYLNDKSRESKPKDCPSGTKPIDQSDLGREDIHKIKDQIGAGPKDWVGVSPDGDIITSDWDGNAENNGPISDYLP